MATTALVRRPKSAMKVNSKAVTKPAPTRAGRVAKATRQADPEDEEPRVKKVRREEEALKVKKAVREERQVRASVPSSVPRFISLRDLEEATTFGVFVENASPRTHRGDILFSTPKIHGNGVDPVRVVKTWIPQDLTEQVTREQLLSSSEFRQTVSKGLINLLSAEYARNVLSQPDAQEEARRVSNLRSASAAIMRASAVTRDTATDENMTPTQRRRQQNIDNANAENDARQPVMDPSADSFSIQVQAWAEMSDADALNAIRNEGELTIKELKTIGRTMGETHPKVGRYIRKQLEG